MQKYVSICLFSTFFTLNLVQILQTKYSSSHNTNPPNTTDEDEDNEHGVGDNPIIDVRVATTTANKSHSWRGDHPMKDQQNGYVSAIQLLSEIYLI